MTGRPSRVVTIEALTRVEGEGALRVAFAGDAVDDVQLRIYEPPRLFEGLLEGRAATEAPDITARICGICPVAYQTSACWAVEDACGVDVPAQVRALRRLLYCGEWISSHALHVYLLHVPDFLGYDGAVELAADHPELVERGLRLKHAGNTLLETVGGRSVHPVNVRVGGFHRFPAAARLQALRPDLERALDDALATVATVAGFDVPDVELPYEYVALRPEEGYPIESGRVVTSTGDDLAVADFLELVQEIQQPYSTALHARLAGRDAVPYLVGPNARYTLNADRLSAPAQDAARAAGLGPVCRNPYRSIVVRAVELVEACHEALRLIDAWRDGGVPAVPAPPRAGTGYGASEAPRGVLFHSYRLDERGLIRQARIIAPTSQNQAAIEADLRASAQAWVHLDDAELRARCERTVRNYDPCISCATHFLDLTVERT